MSVAVAVSSVEAGVRSDVTREHVPAYIETCRRTAKRVDVRRFTDQWEAVYVKKIDFDAGGNAHITLVGQKTETVALAETRFRPHVSKSQR